MTAPGNRTYTILDIDLEGATALSLPQPVNQVMLGRLAARFNVATPSAGSGAGWAPPWLAIWLASSKDGKFKNSTIEWFTENVEVGSSVEIPYAGDEWDWRNVTLTASSLDEVCAQDRKKPDPLRIGGPALTPELLYFHVFNEVYRGLYTKRLSPGSRRNVDLDPGSLRFEKGDALFLPYPIRRKGMIVKATPSNGASPSATAALAPPWVIQFYDLLNTIEKTAAELAPLNKICLRLEHDGIQSWAHVQVLHELVRFQHATVGGDARAALQVLEGKFDELEKQAKDVYFVNVAAICDPETTSKRKKVAEDLRALLDMDRPPTRDGELSRRELETMLSKFPRERINQNEQLIDMKDRVLTRGYLALGASPCSDVAHTVAAKVLDETLLAADSGALSASAAVGAMTSVVTTSLGNLPGSSTLVVAFVWFHVNFKLTDAAKAAVDPARTMKVEPELIRKLIVWASLTEEEGQLIAKAAASTDPVVIKEAAASLKGAFEKIKKSKYAISSAVSDNYMVAPGWNIAITIINMIALINTLQTDDEQSLRKIANLLGGTVMTGLGGVQTLASLSPGGVFERMLLSVGRRYSILAMVASIVSGTITAFRETGTAATIGGIFQAAGGSFSLAGFLFGATPLGFGLVVTGGVLMAASVVPSNWDAIVRRWLPGPLVVLREHLGRFYWYPGGHLARPALDAALKAVLEQIEGPDHSGLHDFEGSDSNAAKLRALRFAESDIDLMTYRPFFQRDRVK